MPARPSHAAASAMLASTLALAGPEAMAAEPLTNGYLPADRIPWMEEIPGMAHRLGPLWGVREDGPAGTLLKVPGRWEAPVHAHTADYRAVVIEGTWTHWVPETGDGEGIELPPGSYWTQIADQMHGDACISAEPCIILLINEDPYTTYFEGQ